MIKQVYDELVYKEATEEAPCQRACPAGIDVPRYVRLINAGKFNEARAVIREKIPFPSVCGHVCFHPCEDKCRLGEFVGIPVATKALHRFAAEQPSGVEPEVQPTAKSTGKSVAVVGSGPAGLTAAYYLALFGHSVTVFESLPEPGGMMYYCIPEYRLPREVLNKEIHDIEKAGVKINLNSQVDSLDSLLSEGYNAVYLALGAGKGIPIGLSGEDSPRVRECVSFLTDLNSGKKIKLGERVGVIGGGNAAIDGARTALRLDAKKVTIIYRRTRAEMPASPEEIEAALEEGVEIVFLAAPTKIMSQIGTVKVQFTRMKLGEVDASGRQRPEPIKGSDFDMEFDTLIVGIGQQPDIPDGLGLSLGKGQTIDIDKDSLATSREGVFAGGDVVTGPASVIEAIAMGRKAAISMDKYLGGNGVIDAPLAPPEDEGEVLESPFFTPVAAGPNMHMLPVAERLTGFAEVELGLTKEEAIAHSKRCLRCDQTIIANQEECRQCHICQLVCSLGHENSLNPTKARIKIGVTFRQDGKYITPMSFTDDCDSCGLCVRYCPYEALSRVNKKRES